MTEQARFSLRGRNPDVLTCIANLSNDEVFTPPEIANKMLDSIADAWAADHDGDDIWGNPSIRFIDPFTKSGIFLREITSRLTSGLKAEFPNLERRVDHILTKQVFGMGITQLTSLLARRSLYCSKHANGTHSIANSFSSEDGNIWFERMEHSWEGKKCEVCGAPREHFDREEELENYAYAFIHFEEIKTSIAKVFGGEMQFDIVIGNPPYQMKGGAGGSSDSSIYHLFVNQAIKLGPRYVSMVVPSRWMAGGRGLDEFREHMLGDGHLRILVDYPDSSAAFPGVQIKGGVCFFLWDGDHNGPCSVIRNENGNERLQPNRELGEFDIFVRDDRALSILKKVLKKQQKSIQDMVSGDTPFGIATNFSEWTQRNAKEKISLHLIHNGKRQIGFMKRDHIRKNKEIIDDWKIFVPKAYGAGESFPHQILGREIIAPPPSVCTQSYLVISPFQSETAARSFASYYRSRLFRFLVSLRKITQDALRSTYKWVPQQGWDRIWTDEVLYKKYNISSDEVAYIESVIRPMSANE